MSAETATAVPSLENRGATQVGIVRSDKRQKTITVEVRRLIKHPRYGKYIYRSTHYHAHDEKNEAKKGDRVEIRPSRPLSKQKRWRLIRVLERAVVLDSLEIKEVDVLPTKRSASPSKETVPGSEVSPEAARGGGEAG